MSLANLLKDRVQIQLRVATLTADGETVTWVPVESRYALVIPVGARTKAVYQQLNSEVTHRIVLRGPVSLNLGLNRLKWGDITLEPVELPKQKNSATTIMTKEV